MNKSIFVFFSLFVCYACTQQRNYPFGDYKLDYDGLMDTILPHFASLHDSIPGRDRFLPKNKEYMKVHKAERQYEWMNYTEKQGYCYFMISRLQPSMKKDKFIAICGRFKRNNSGRIDSATYEELFWTWKMKKDSLKIKTEILFRQVVETGDINQYAPENSNGYWVEFPDKNVYYDKATQSWRTKHTFK